MELVISTMETLDETGAGVIEREIIEPVLKEILKCNDATLDELLQNFRNTYVGKEFIDYIALLNWIFGIEVKKPVPAPRASQINSEPTKQMGELAWLR